ncbi:MAG: hypothetical protein P8104_02005 [Gammaproteobacteria bacterium]
MELLSDNVDRRRVEQNNALRQKLCQEIQEFSSRLQEMQPLRTELQKVLACNYLEMIESREELLGLL